MKCLVCFEVKPELGAVWVDCYNEEAILLPKETIWKSN